MFGLSLRNFPVILLAAIFISMIGCSDKVAKEPLNAAQVAKLQTWLEDNGKSPTAYVLDKFTDHDVVLLGEPHRFRDHSMLVQQLIPLLPQNGVHILATEFARAVDQHLVDSLLSGPEWDEHLAREIQLRQYSLWPWREYLDIFKAAWQYNQNLDSGQVPFCIIGVNCDPDWTVIQTREDLDNPEKRRAAWKGCDEGNWAAVVLKEVRDGEKVLGYCGMHHAFSGYRQPRVDDKAEFRGWGDVRFGNHLRDSLGERVFTIALHQPWYEKHSLYNKYDLRPVGGAIDQVMESREGGPRPVGFDVVGNPFGDLTDTLTIYSVGYDHFTLATYCDGYIYFRPFAESELVTFIEGFYNEDNIDIARTGVPNPWYRDATPEQFEEQMKKQLRREKEHLAEL